MGSSLAWSGFFHPMLIVLPLYLFRPLVCLQVPMAMGKDLVQAAPSVYTLQCGKSDNIIIIQCSYVVRNSMNAFCRW